MSALQLDIMGACVCGCCHDAVERHESLRDARQACDCAWYEPDEQCDCFFCTDVLNGHR